MKASKPLLRSILVWLGFAQPENSNPIHDQHHGHTHGVVDPTIATTERGIWAIKWSFIILAITALFQIVIVLLSDSVALLADTIHNVGDAGTAVPLWIAFLLVRRKPSARFTYGFGRAEDLAGILIVLIILFSAMVAGYSAIDRLLHPQPIQHLFWVMIAGVMGFIGNEAVAVLRIRVGRQINSAALIADGYHARTDGFTSLAVVLGAVGVWSGFPLADPIVGMLITIAIFGIVWQSAKAVLTRMLDGVEPEVIAEIRHAAEHVPGIRAVLEARARWLGHRLVAELDVAIDGHSTVNEADVLLTSIERAMHAHLPALQSTRIRIRPASAEDMAGTDESRLRQHGIHQYGHVAPEPVAVHGHLASGIIEIVDTPAGERMRFTASEMLPNLEAEIMIHRNGTPEVLQLASLSNSEQFESASIPGEPHEFMAELRLRDGDRSEVLPFRMHEPHGHH